MAIAVLSVDIVAKLASFEQDLAKAARASQRASTEMASAFGLAREGLKGLASGIAAGFSIAAIKSFFQTTINGLDALNDLRDATGASIEKLSALEDVAARTGNKFETVGDALIKLNKALAEAKPGSELANTFKRIGLSVEELRKLDPADALQRVSKALSLFADDQQKAAVVQDIFGKTIRQVAPLLNDLASRNELVGTTTEKATKEAEKFNQELAKMAKNSTDAARSILGVLLPTLNKRLEAGNKEGFLAFFGFDSEFFEKKKLAEAAAEVQQLDGYLRKLKADKEGGIGYFKDVDEQIKNVTRDLEIAKAKFRELDPLRKEQQAAAALAGSAGDYSNEGRGRPQASIAEAETQAFLKFREMVQKRIALAREEDAAGEPLRESRKVQLDLLAQISDATSGLTAKEKELAKAEVARLVSRLKLNESNKASLDRTLAEGRALAQENQQRQQANKVLQEQNEEIGLSQRQIEDLRQARLAEAIATEEQRAATLALFDAQEASLNQMKLNTEELRKSLKLRQEAIDKARKQAADPLKGAADAVDDYFEKISRAGDATREAVSGAFTTLEDDLTKSLKNARLDAKNFVDYVITEFYRLKVVRPLLQSIGGEGGSSFTGLLSGIFSQSGSSSYPTIGGGAGDSAGYITPSAGPQSASGGRLSMGNTYNIQVGSDVSRGEVYDAVTKAVAASEGRQMQRLRAAGVV